MTPELIKAVISAPPMKQGEVVFTTTVRYDEKGLIQTNTEAVTPKGVTFDGFTGCSFSLLAEDVDQSTSRSIMSSV